MCRSTSKATSSPTNRLILYSNTRTKSEETTRTRTVTRLFDNYADAQAAVTRLEAMGVPHADISIVASNADGRHGDGADRGPLAGVPGRPIGGAVAGAAAGGATGGVVGALT